MKVVRHKIISLIILFAFSQIAYGGESTCAYTVTSQQSPSDPFYEFFNAQDPVRNIVQKIDGISHKVFKAKERLAKHETNSKKFFFFFYERLSAAEIAALNLEIQDNKKQIAKLVEDIKETKRKLTELQQKVLRNAVDQQHLRSHIVERLKYLTLKSLKSSRTVSLSLGSLDASPSQSLQNEVKRLVEGIVRLNYNIIFDADSNLAPLIAQIAGNRAIGVGLTTPTMDLKSPVLVLKNIYHKFQALNHGHLRIADPTSVSGFAQFLTNDLNIMLDPEQVWNVNGFANWEKYLNRNNKNIGIKTPYVWAPYSASAALSFSHKDKNGKWTPLLKYDTKSAAINFTKIESLNYDQVQSVRTYVQQMAYSAASISKLRGAVIFGSSGLHRSYASGAYLTAHALARSGYAVRTGGSGGLMLAANMGAFDAGGTSIGIPRASFDLKNEQYFPTNLHDHTVFTADYTTRIPLLLDADLIVFQPGRDGTLRELGLALMQQASGQSNSLICFYNSDFYREFYTWLTQQPALHSIKSNFLVEDNPDRIADLASQIGARRVPLLRPLSLTRQEFPLNHDGLEAP